jgi:hypothetical protein
MGKSVSTYVILTSVTSLTNTYNETSGDDCNMSEIIGRLVRIGDFFQSSPVCYKLIFVLLGPGHPTCILPDPGYGLNEIFRGGE